ncbi:serine protease [Candidatus Uhrbacteria bacterium]|nr:serine protease [Candidatus Uhrbacteria bacterium]
MNIGSWPHFFSFILLSLAVGLGAGIIGTALTTDYLSEYAFGLSRLTEPLRMTQELPRAIPKNYEDALSLLRERALPAVGSLFENSQVIETGIPFSLSHIPVIALTSDGWVLTPQAALGDRVQWQAQQCEIDKRIDEPLTGFVFAHCQTINVPVVNFGSGYDVAVGDQVFVVSTMGKVNMTSVSSLTWGTRSVESSDIPLRRIHLVNASELEHGSAVFNLFGDLVGIISQTETSTDVIPFEQFSGAFRQVLLPSEVIVYPALGLQGIDLARTVGVSPAFSRGLRHGFLLYGTQTLPSGNILNPLPLVEGDIILSVEGVAIGPAFSLDDLLVSYAPGDHIRLTIDREGVQQEVTLTLGELKL